MAIRGPTDASSATDPAERRLAVHGAVDIVDADGRSHPVPGRQPQLVLAYLVVEARPVRRDELAELLWGETDLPDHWPGAVRGVLSKVRAALVAGGLPAETLQTGDGLVQVTLPPEVPTDLALAQDELDGAQAALDGDDPTSALGAARAALAVLGPGPFLPQADGDWVRLQRQRVEDLLRRAHHLEIGALLAGGQAADAARRATDLIGADPLDETAHHLRIEALVAAGHRSPAIRAYEQLAAILDRELGISPSESTAALLGPVRAPLPAAAPSTPSRVDGPAPRSAARRVPERFVGRTAELARLEELWHRVVDEGRPQVAVIEGPTGIGKTSLARELVARRAAEGARVLWGRCRATTGLAYEPVAEALRAAYETDADLTARAGRYADGLVDVLPELLPGPPPLRSSDDPAVARGHLFRSVAAAVADVATEPTVWVVDDLQWASEDTLGLLEVVLDGLARPLLLVATSRNAPPTVEAGLARLPRVVPLATLTLDGFSEGDLVSLLADLGTDAGPADPELARALHLRTAGHPFLVTEITSDARRTGGPVDPDLIPDGARDWIGRRAASLRPALAARLDLAAVIGVEVELDLLARCSSEPVDVVLDQVEELADHGLLVESPIEGAFAFPHVITRDVVYQRLGATRRARLHRRVADATAHGPDQPGRAAMLAHHYGRGGAGAAGLAAAHGLEAGRESLARSAWALAVEQLTAVAERAGTDDELRARALVELGRALHANRDPTGAQAVLEEAIALARSADLPHQMAAAVLLLVGRAGRGAALDMSDHQRSALLREALAGLDPDGGADPARDALLGRLEGELVLSLLLTDAPEERARLASSTVARARSAARPDPSALARALLTSRVTKLEPHRVDERIADLDEIALLPPGELSPDLLITVLYNRHEDHLLVGKREAARRDLEQASELADRYRHPHWQWAVRTWQVLGQIIDGHLDEAEDGAAVAAALQVGDRGEPAACFGVNLVDIRLYQGRAGEVVDLLGQAVTAFPHVPCYRAVLALCCAEAGRTEEAQAALDHFTRHGITNLPDDTNRFLGLAVLADAAVTLGDVAAGRLLTPLLEPYRELHVVLNCYGGGGSFWGPTRHQLARLAALDGRGADAAALFRQAREAALAFDAPLAARRIADDEAALTTG
ncbi:MAG TPA: AAA family ATPase [Iamia sp.]|nr:AAA family ATPase [Iamia sp.]